MSAQDSSRVLHAIGTVKIERRSDALFGFVTPSRGVRCLTQGKRKRRERENVRFAVMSANRYMRLYENRSKLNNVLNLSEAYRIVLPMTRLTAVELRQAAKTRNLKTLNL
jgi:hypothetical protein